MLTLQSQVSQLPLRIRRRSAMMSNIHTLEHRRVTNGGCVEGLNDLMSLSADSASPFGMERLVMRLC